MNDPDPLRERIVGVFRNAEAGEMFTLDDLADEVRAEKKDRVAFVLGQLASSNLIDQVVRIMSPVGGGIQEYPSIDNIPDAIYDPFQLKEIEVEPSLVKVFFRKTRIGGGAASDSQSSRRGHALV